MTAIERTLRRLGLVTTMILVLAPLGVVASIAMASQAVSAAPTSSFYFESDMGDAIGHGRTGYGTGADSTFVPREDAMKVTIPDGIRTQTFSLGMVAPAGGPLQPGTTYRGNVFPFNYHGRGNYCRSGDAIVSAFAVHDVAYGADGLISMLSMSVEQACSSTGSFYAELRYKTADPAYNGVMLSPNPYNHFDFDWTRLPDATIGSQSAKVFTMTAVGLRSVAIGSGTLNGSHAGDFRIVDDGCSGQTLGVGSACQYTVRFAPRMRGEREAVVRFGLDTAAGAHKMGIRGHGQVPTTTTMSMPKGPFLYSRKAKLDAQVKPRPDDGGCFIEILYSGPSEQRSTTGCDAQGEATAWINPGIGQWEIRARSVETPDFASSTSDPLTVRWVEEMRDWGTSYIKPAKFYPYKDGYLDALTMHGNRKFPIEVDIAITRAETGEVVATASIPRGTGAYRWEWDGMISGVLAPRGDYDVAVTLSDQFWNELTVTKQVHLSHKWVKWTRKSVTLPGKAFSLKGTSKNGSVSRAKSKYANGVRLGSGKGAAAVEYAFPVAKSEIYGWVSVSVRGRSPNGHKALSSIWNPKLGGYRDLGNFDAAVLIGPGYKWWKTGADGSDRVRRGKIRSAVMVWKGLGKAGPAAFDIKSVKLTYKVGKLMAPTSGSALSSLTTSNTPAGIRVSRYDVSDRLPTLQDVANPPELDDYPTVDEDQPAGAPTSEPEPQPGTETEPMNEPEPNPDPSAEPVNEGATPMPAPSPSPSPNEPPIADAGGPYMVEEGGTVKLDGRRSHDPDGEIVAYAWSRPARLDDPSAVRPIFTAVDDGGYDIGLFVTDDDGAETKGKTKVKVTNVDPVIEPIGDRDVSVGEELVLKVAFDDPGVRDTHTVWVAWGDGMRSEAAIGKDLGSGIATAAHVYAEPGTYDLSVRIVDDDDGMVRAIALVRVNEPVEAGSTSGEVDNDRGEQAA